MNNTVAGLRKHTSLALSELLMNGEVIVIADDDASIRAPLSEYFSAHRLAVEECAYGSELLGFLAHRHVALVLLDINLPDADGISLLTEITEKYPDVAVVMLTGMVDLDVALDCIRKGASDFISKPMQLEQIFEIARKSLEKRRLVLENRKYQEQLEEAHFRIQLMHQLSLKMNSVYLSTVELDEILRAILVGITAEEGLGFNRAFLAMFDENQTMLEGRLAIGPSCREEAGRVWAELREKRFNFLDIVQNLKNTCHQGDIGVNCIVAALEVPVTEKDNILIRSALERRSIKVDRDNDCIPLAIERRMRNLFFYYDGSETFPYERRAESIDEKPYSIPHDLISLLDEDAFVVVPLYSPRRSFGVIIADNFVTRQPISEGHINSLELFASQASLAIEHSNLYIDMQQKIGELQTLNHELDKNKDLLVAAERYSALGQMAAQLVHAIRNPVTSIGGVSRILAKKITEEEILKYLHVIIKETERLESTLADLFDFVTERELQKERVPLYTVIKKTVMLMQNTITEKNISLEYELPGHELELELDLAQFRQMFLHLVRNAVEAMPNGGTLSINVYTENDRVAISIADTGTGIPKGYIDHAKDPFFTTKTYGTGMGLSLVERIVKAHGGEFQLISRDNGGMEARIYFPLPE